MQMDLSKDAHCHVCEAMCETNVCGGGGVYNKVKYSTYSISPDLASNQERLARRAIENIECMLKTGWISENRLKSLGIPIV